jgi:hypothetical protein
MPTGPAPTTISSASFSALLQKKTALPRDTRARTPLLVAEPPLAQPIP